MLFSVLGTELAASLTFSLDIIGLLAEFLVYPQPDFTHNIQLLHTHQFGKDFVPCSIITHNKHGHIWVGGHTRANYGRIKILDADTFASIKIIFTNDPPMMATNHDVVFVSDTNDNDDTIIRVYNAEGEALREPEVLQDCETMKVPLVMLGPDSLGYFKWSQVHSDLRRLIWNRETLRFRQPLQREWSAPMIVTHQPAFRNGVVYVCDPKSGIKTCNLRSSVERALSHDHDFWKLKAIIVADNGMLITYDQSNRVFMMLSPEADQHSWWMPCGEPQAMTFDLYGRICAVSVADIKFGGPNALHIFAFVPPSL